MPSKFAWLAMLLYAGATFGVETCAIDNVGHVGPCFLTQSSCRDWIRGRETDGYSCQGMADKGNRKLEFCALSNSGHVFTCFLTMSSCRDWIRGREADGSSCQGMADKERESKSEFCALSNAGHLITCFLTLSSCQDWLRHGPDGSCQTMPRHP